MPDLSCDLEQPYLCHLSKPCKTYEWELAFRFDFPNEEGFDHFYINVPLASFAVDNTTTNTCTLYIQNLGTTDD